MKKTVLFLWILTSFSLFAQNYYPCSCLLPEKYVQAVSVTEQIAVRSSLDAHTPNLITMHYGQEKVMLLGQKDSITLGDRRVYTLISLEDGTQGWVEYAKIVPCGAGKVIAQNTGSYKDRNKEEASGYAFRAGEAVIATETSGDLIYVYSKNKSKKGWVSVYEVISGNQEFLAGISLEKALVSNSVYGRKVALEQLQSSINSNMRIYPIVQNEYAQVANATPPPSNLVPVYAANASRGLHERPAMMPVPTAPKPALSERPALVPVPAAPKPATRSAEKPSSSLTLVTPSKPAVSAKTMPEKPVKQAVTPTEKPATNRGIAEMPVKKAVAKPQKNTEKYVLAKTSKIAPDKVFACLHPKLPVGTKVRVPLTGNAGYVVMEVLGKSAANTVEMSDATIKRVFGNQIPQKVEVQYFTVSSQQ